MGLDRRNRGLGCAHHRDGAVHDSLPQSDSGGSYGLTLLVFPARKAIYGTAAIAPFPVVSHNGKNVAFVAIQDGISRIWVRSLDSLEPKLLSGTEGALAAFPFWAPDDRFIAFFTSGKLKKVDLSGGPAQVICDVAGGFGGSWNRDGIIIFTEGVLKRVSAAGGRPESITTLDSNRHEVAHTLPVFLPDGNHFLFLSRTNSNDTYAVMAGSLNSKELKTVMNGNSRVEYDSGQVLVYRTGSQDANRRLEWFDRSGRSLGVVGQPGAYRNPELSPDGKRIAVERTDPQTQNDDIWIFDVARSLPNRLTFDPGIDMYPVWSPTASKSHSEPAERERTTSM